MKIRQTLPILFLSLIQYSFAVNYQWDGGAGTGDWQTATNWSPDATNSAFNGTFADRLNVNGAQALIYTSAEGTTNYGTAGIRGLAIGSGSLGAGTMEITGGTFSSYNANAADVIGNATTAGVTSSLIISGGTFIGSSAGTQNNFGATNQNGIITVNSGSATFTTLTVSNAGSGTGTVNLNGGTLAANMLNKISTGTANVNLNGGTLKAMQTNTSFMQGLNAATMNAGATIDSNGFHITIGQALIAGTGAGTLTKISAGTLTLTGANTYAGATSINAGGIVASNVSALGTNAAGTTVATNAALGLSGGLNFNTGESVTISGPGLLATSGAFTAVQRGAIQSVSGDNTFTGNINFTNTTNTRIGVQDGATLTLTGNITEQTAGSSIAFRHGNTAGSNITISGTANSWTGNTDIFGGGGAVILGNNNALSTTALLRVGTTGITGNSKLDLNGYNQTIPGISQVGGTAGIITNNGSSDSLLTITGMSANQGYFGSIQDGATNKVSLVLNSTGNTQALSGANSYTGTTTVTAGRLNINGSITSATTVASGATLGGDGVINANVTLNGILRPGQGGTTDRTLSITGTLSATIGSAMMFNIASETAHDQLSVGGISLTNTTLNIESFTDTTITELGAGQGLSFLTSGASFYKIIDGTTTGMFANVTNTMTAEQLTFYGLSGTQYTFEVDGQKFWIAEGSTYLVAIPESSTSLLGLLGGLALFRRKRK